MRKVSNSAYIDNAGKYYVKSREIGYEEYAYVKDDGTLGICGGFVGPCAGWKEITSENQTKEDKKFLQDIEDAVKRPIIF